MNICFVRGKIVSDIRFDFIINDKNNISICYFDLLLSNGSVVKVIAYNEIADFCYSKFSRNDFVNIEGYLNKDYGIVINNCYFVKGK